MPAYTGTSLKHYLLMFWKSIENHVNLNEGFQM